MSTTTAPIKVKDITAAAEAHISELLKEKLPPTICFHNLGHTQQVKDAVIELSKAASLDARDQQVLILAAFFHNTGMVHNQDDFLKKSCEIATNFLKEYELGRPLTEDVNRLIMALSKKEEPSDFLEKLFVDAHYSFMGKKGFKRRSKRLRNEKESIEDVSFEEVAWSRSQLSKLKEHVYYTKFAQELYSKRKMKNIKKVKKWIKKQRKAKKARLKSTSVSANSGARTMFKTALRNHIDLTNIADQKANIMLSINALIITIGLPAFSTYLSDTSYLIIPAIIFLMTSVAAMIIATLSTRPIKMDGETDLSKLLTGKTNLFFFGNFYRLPRKDYQEAIKKVVADREYLDTSFINDLYYLGLALGDKFRYLRLCYNVFVIGVSLSVVAFVIAYIVSSTT